MELSVTNVTKRFGGLTALDNVQFEVESGEIIGLIGPNGAGKTTLFNCMTGIHKPEEGVIELNGNDLTTKDVHRVCKHGIGRTFQDVRTFDNLSVFDNVLAGAVFGSETNADNEDHVREYIEFVDLSEKEALMVENLTVADRRRLEIARALATDPEVILLDEVATGLTPSEVTEISETIQAIRAEFDISVIWIEHNIDAVMGTVDRVIVLHHGQRIADGRPQNVRTDEQVINAYLGEKA